MQHSIFFPGASGYILYHRKNSYYKTVKRYENVTYQEFARVFCWFKSDKWEGLQLFTFLQMHVCIVCI